MPVSLPEKEENMINSFQCPHTRTHQRLGVKDPVAAGSAPWSAWILAILQAKERLFSYSNFTEFNSKKYSKEFKYQLWVSNIYD